MLGLQLQEGILGPVPTLWFRLLYGSQYEFAPFWEHYFGLTPMCLLALGSEPGLLEGGPCLCWPPWMAPAYSKMK